MEEEKRELIPFHARRHRSASARKFRSSSIIIASSTKHIYNLFRLLSVKKKLTVKDREKRSYTAANKRGSQKLASVEQTIQVSRYYGRRNLSV